MLTMTQKRDQREVDGWEGWGGDGSSNLRVRDLRPHSQTYFGAGVEEKRSGLLLVPTAVTELLP